MKASFFRTASVFSIICASAMGSGLAQQEVPGEVAERADADTIIVTGSRIKGLDADGAVQALSLGRDDLLETGATNLVDALKVLPVTGGGRGTFSTSTAGALSGDTPPGAASVSLRGLGPSSTLTLINGRRASITSFAVGQENFIDVNALPFAAVERVEVLPNGASAIYGADAIAGVVNYVLRDDFNGFEVSATYGNSTADTDEGEFNANAVWGRANDRHSVLLVADYFKRNALFDRDRESTANSVRPSEQGFYPSFNDLFLMFFDQTEEPGEGGCDEENFGFGDFGEFCAVNTNAFTSTQDEYESIGLMGSYKMFIGERTTWFNELIFSRNESEGTSSPANFSRAPVDPTNPNFPQALIDDIVEEANVDNPGTVYEDFFGFPIFAWGKFLEPRAVEVESTTFRLVSGIEHELTNGWNLEGAVVYGRNESEQRGISGLIRTEPFYDSLLGNLCADGSTIDRWDVDPERPDASFNGGSCEDVGQTTLWYNPFGGQTNQPDGLAELIETDAERNGEAQLVQVDVTASGDIMEFGGGAIAGAFGAEFRYEELEDLPADVAVATLGNPNPILGFSSTAAKADRSQWAAYGELYVPFTEDISMQLAGRYDWTDDFGDSFNPKIALRYQPVEQLILRGNWSTSFRAPSLAQIGADVRLTSYRTDCSITPQACGGDIDSDGVSLLSEEVGNRDLQPEEAETWSVGTVFAPTKDITLTIDYWNIRHEDLIGVDEDDFIRRALLGEFQVVNVSDGFLPTGTPGLEVTDDPGGDGIIVTDAHFSLTNLGFQETSGIDVSYTHYIDLGPGELSFLADAGYLLQFDRKASETAEIVEEAGEFTYPELLLRGSVRYTHGPWRFSSRVFYTSSYNDDPSQRIVDAAIENGFVPEGTTVDREIDAWTTVDLSASYDFAENSFIQLSVENVFDEDPPLALATGSNVDFFNHDSMGRFVALRLNTAF